jgi:hypothetical protein
LVRLPGWPVSPECFISLAQALELRNRTQHWIVLLGDTALIAVAVIAFVAGAIGFGDSSVELQSYDYRALFSYQMDFFRAALLDGRLPLWNPHIFGGSPFLANPQTAVFYPTSLLFLWLPQSQALSAELTIHLIFAAAGTYALARFGLGTSRGSAILAGLVFAACGAMFSRVLFGHRLLIMAAAYIPMLVFVIDRAVERVGLWPWLGGLLLAMQILSGGLPAVWLGLLFIGLLRVSHIVSQRPMEWRDGRRDLIVLATVVIAGISLAAVQLIPSTQFAELSNRPEHNYAYVSFGSYDPKFLPTFLWRSDLANSPDWWWIHYSYIGFIPVVLAGIALIGGFRERPVIMLASVGVIIFLYMLGSNSFLLPVLFKYVPTFDLFRHPSRALIVIHLIIALLAAVGLDKICERLQTRFVGPKWPAVALVVLVCLISLADLTTSANWYRERAFVPDGWRAEIPSQARRNEIIANDRSWYRYWFNRRLYRQNDAYSAEARNIDGYDVMIIGRYERFIHAMTDTTLAKRQLTHITPNTFLTAPSSFPFKIMGVKYADTPNGVVKRNDAESISRAWFVTEMKTLKGEADVLSYMRSDAYRPYREVVFENAEKNRLETRPATANAAANSPAARPAVTELSPEQLIIDLEPHPPGYLVLSEIFYPGWRARIDGIPAPVYRCNSILRCLQLHGRDEPTNIVMEFQPATSRWGAIISGLSFIIILCGLWLGRQKTTAY